MSYEDYEAALEDLQADAETWTALSETFTTVVSTIEGCVMGRYEMDGIGHMVGAEENYNSAHGTIYDLASAAPQIFADISTKLSDTKKAYEEADGYSKWLLDQG